MTDKEHWLVRLKNKWNLKSITQVILALCTFAIGGSMCGFLGKKLMAYLAIDNSILWLIVYIIIVTILWPICVLVVSIFFGQFNFFKRYIAQLGKKMFGRKNG